MPGNKSEIILSILSASIFILLLVVAVFLLFRIYVKKKNALLLEQERMKLAFEQTLFTSRLEMQEQAFTQISQEIHDNIGQVLSLVRLNLNTMGLPEERIAGTDQLLEQAIGDLRHLSHNLNTSRILEKGFIGAVRQLLEHLSKTRQFQTELQAENIELTLAEEKSIILFRTVQEVVNNIIHHARATQVTIRLESPANELRVMIIDNGIGFDLKDLDTAKGLGIRNMQQRVRMIQGELSIHSHPQEGTSVFITIPINDVL